MTNHIYSRAVDVDIDSDTVDIANHNGSSTGLALNSTLITASASVINSVCGDSTSKFVTMTNTTAVGEQLTIDLSVHANKIIIVDLASTYNGVGVTAANIYLPAATGSGKSFKIFIKRTLTTGPFGIPLILVISASTIVSTGRLYGHATEFQSGGSTATHTESTSGSTFLSFTAPSTGIKGDMFTITDVGVDQWHFRSLTSRV